MFCLSTSNPTAGAAAALASAHGVSAAMIFYDGGVQAHGCNPDLAAPLRSDLCFRVKASVWDDAKLSSQALVVAVKTDADAEAYDVMFSAGDDRPFSALLPKKGKGERSGPTGSVKILPATILVEATSASGELGVSPAIVASTSSSSGQGCVNLDVPVYASSSESCAEVWKRVTGALVAMLAAARKRGATATLVFQGHRFLFALPFASATDDKANAALRKEYHHLLLAPEDRPRFRVGNTADEAGKLTAPCTDKPASVHLRNVHRGLPPSGVANGTLYLVNGNYDYYHYKQDGFDDNGWGCAYRSLQTLTSWLKCNGYAQRQPPGHKEIQETLVKAKDKEPSFLGSKNWIGAFECALVLDILYGVPCKILNVNSGSELAEKGRELSRHFTTQGSPVMVGGGVLAYTLLGIDYNADTGAIAFLILDPHYPNASDDDMRVIHKNWCKWYGPEIFRADSFYNLCCPQKPNEI
jgi:hypothetical protein